MTGRRNLDGGDSMLTPVIGIVWFCTFISWIVLLGGIASLQHNCHFLTNLQLYTVGIPGFPAAGGCSHLYQFWWFIWALQFCILAGLIVAMATGRLYNARLLWTSLLAVQTVLTILGSNAFLYFRYRVVGNNYTRAGTTSAGFIMTATCNFLMLICVALLDSFRANTVDDDTRYDTRPSGDKAQVKAATTATEVPTTAV